jgi:hypothetical protein
MSGIIPDWAGGEWLILQASIRNPKEFYTALKSLPLNGFEIVARVLDAFPNGSLVIIICFLADCNTHELGSKPCRSASAERDTDEQDEVLLCNNVSDGIRASSHGSRTGED